MSRCTLCISLNAAAVVAASASQAATPTSSSTPSATRSRTASQTPSTSWTASQTRTVSRTASQTPTHSVSSTRTRSPPIRVNGYSGTGLDPCSRGLTTMYPFGARTADLLGAVGDDENSITLSWTGAPFKFVGVNYNVMYFSTNAWLSFMTDDVGISGVLFPTYYNAVGGNVTCVLSCSRVITTLLS